MRIITVSREFGSGGRELGKRLSEKLGIAYYDKEIITEIARSSDLDEKYVEKVLENSVQHYAMTLAHSFAHFSVQDASSPNLLAQQTLVIKNLASKGDCVIVGRSADVILRDLSPMRLFVYSDMESKVERCRARSGEDDALTVKQMIRKIKQIDRARAANHDFVSPIPWGDRSGYDLCINTTGSDIKSLIPSLASYCENWFSSRGVSSEGK